MGKDSQKSVLSTLFKFARVRTAHQPHVGAIQTKALRSGLITDDKSFSMRLLHEPSSRIIKSTKVKTINNVSLFKSKLLNFWCFCKEICKVPLLKAVNNVYEAWSRQWHDKTFILGHVHLDKKILLHAMGLFHWTKLYMGILSLLLHLSLNPEL